jgi:glucosamine--fructose-6-phosphate aminotransferase (isomerizing)
MPRIMSQVLNAVQPQIEALSRDLSKFKDVLYLGRGTSYPLALEGALKLKEISYIHAEGYAAGELKHGPIALIDEETPTIALAPLDDVFEKTASNLQEVAARGGPVIMIAPENAPDPHGAGIRRIHAPDCHPLIAPLVYAVPMQLLAYYTAVQKGTDVDQPRNLAKSVTVE